ncbi:hypothetical protein [Parvularcula sp. LCG005]|uniref:DNA-3-methyladenine glycosylase family protein n=1 Tax=Parvularcula sp. LCG005 TaxID=3078805 RepID=UPI00294290D6|nr:hypothetical protein [Parvularcula sp. LCG005]WOI54782.1 hypothetical protein RUI03_07200 [Parvularcula sp. LCG005]
MATCDRSSNVMLSDDLTEALAALRQADPIMARAIDAIGTPVIRHRPPGYAGLFRIIVEQQVSVASARSIMTRCDTRLGSSLKSQQVLDLTEEDLRKCGLSGPKIRYVRAVAEAEQSGQLNLATLKSLNDRDAAAHLTAIKGVGPWTAGIYLLFCDGRPDIWPSGDVALLAAYCAASGMTVKPPMKQFDEGAARFSPYRGIAAHCLWTYYGKLKGRAPN